MSTDITGTHVEDEEILTTFPTDAQGSFRPAASTGPRDADGTDADGTDGDGTDGVDGDSGGDTDGTDDSDGTDGGDADGTDA